MKISSVWVSRAEVASSRSRICPGRSSERAMEIRWACPSERPEPFSPNMVSRPSGNSNTNEAEAMRKTFSSWVSFALALPKSRLLRMVPLKREPPCGT